MFLITKEDWLYLKNKKESDLIQEAKLQLKVTKFMVEFTYYLQKKSQSYKFFKNSQLKAQVIYHRFKAVKGNGKIKDLFYGAVCLFIVGKDDRILFNEEICVRYYITLNQKKKALENNNIMMIAKLETDEKLIEYSNNLDINKIERKKDKLRQIELEILKAIGYDLEIEVLPIYIDKFINEYIQYCGQNKLPEEQKLFDVLKNSELWGNDIYRSNLCLYYHPFILALTALNQAQKSQKFDLPNYNNKKWWQFFDENIDLNEIEEATYYFKNFIRYLQC